MADQIQLRRDTAANWTSANPILASGEFGIETNTLKIKVGDGTTAWTSLDYFAYASLSDINDVTITDIASGEILKWNGSAWVNNTIAEAGLATAAQGALADSAVQPGDLATVATSGAYSDLSGTPTLGTLSSQDASAVTFTGSIEEAVFTVTGTTPALDPANGTIQTWTLTAASTPTDSLAAGEAITLIIDDGTAYTITWPTTTWVNNAGAAPTLATDAPTVIALWKVSTTLYGALVGDGS